MTGKFFSFYLRHDRVWTYAIILLSVAGIVAFLLGRDNVAASLLLALIIVQLPEVMWKLNRLRDKPPELSDFEVELVERLRQLKDREGPRAAADELTRARPEVRLDQVIQVVAKL